MLTNEDIELLKRELSKVFATKDDLKQFATKDDLKNFVTKDDLSRTEQRLIEYVEIVCEGVKKEITQDIGKKIDVLTNEIISTREDMKEFRIFQRKNDELELRIFKLESR